ncbi:hypothetical protein [Candidatus Poriferisocius sp.]|uniref:hypothetical protein n=1 Tax=Candidatus Poriferisocius sp. TaxID=3101276 RepID=UPI003B015E1F
MTVERPVAEQTSTSFSVWQQSMVDKKRQDRPSHELVGRQQQFLKAANGSSSLLADYLIGRLNIEEEALAQAPALDGVTSDEMNKTPLIWEQHVGSQLSGILPIQAISSPWWYICHAAWLRGGVFPDPPNSTFKARVGQETLEKPADRTSFKEKQTLDTATRNLLRGLGGLPHIRHVKAVATDPPIARAHWRYRLGAEAAANAPPESGLTAESCHELLHRSSWVQFIDRSQMKYSAVLAPKALAAVCAIAAHDPKGIREYHLQAVARRCLQAHPDLINWQALTQVPEEPETPRAKPPSRKTAKKRGKKRSRRR